MHGTEEEAKDFSESALFAEFQNNRKNNLLSETAAEDEESENCIGGFEDNEDNFPDEKNIYCFTFI